MSIEDIRRKNREMMPLFTAAFDNLTKAFGPLKVIHVIENDYEVGQIDTESDYVSPYVDTPSATHDDWGRVRKR